MAKYRVGFIGTGKKKERGDAMGYAMAYQHGNGYKLLADCEMVACADIVKENGEAFAKMFGTDAQPMKVYLSYPEMLAKEKLDIVSICTWPKLHAEMTIAAAAAGVKAIHCEKPMALTYGQARAMYEVCTRYGIQLTFNHQRRFGAPFYKAKQLLKSGAVGKLERVEFGAGNLYDYGSHCFDTCNMHNDECAGEWVICQIDYRQEGLVFGAHNENQALALWKYRNGVLGLAATGAGAALVGCHNKIVGSDGVIEIGPMGQGLPVLRVRRHGQAAWEAVDCGKDGLHGPGYNERAIADLVDALKTGREPELSARRALNATELIFACWESSRRRGRVDLPLDISDSPIEAMVAAGELKPKPKTA